MLAREVFPLRFRDCEGWCGTVMVGTHGDFLSFWSRLISYEKKSQKNILRLFFLVPLLGLSRRRTYITVSLWWLVVFNRFFYKHKYYKNTLYSYKTIIPLIGIFWMYFWENLTNIYKAYFNFILRSPRGCSLEIVKQILLSTSTGSRFPS